MTVHKSPQSGAYDSKMNEEDDLEFRDFIESISVTKEELAAMVGTPEFSSIQEVNEYPQEDKKGPPKTNALGALGEFQRRFQRHWEAVAAVFVAATGPEYHARSPRKN